MYLKKILFVCLGNICRSPSAEGVMKKMVEEAGLEDVIYVDSAGTMGYHIGELPDPRMRKHALKRGYELTSLARKFNPDKDFEDFDYIIAMDNENYNDLNAFDIRKKYSSKIFRMVDFCINLQEKEVPDPYYGGAKGFEHVLDILEDACQGLFQRIRNEIKR